VNSLSRTAAQQAVIDLLDGGHEVWLDATGNSMIPLLLHKKSRVLIKKSAPYKKGSIVLYQRESGQFVLHRITGLSADGYTLCGDGQTIREHGVLPCQIYGCVIGFIRKKKEYTTNSIIFRIYSFIWGKIFCVRRYPLALYRRLAAIGKDSS